MSVTSRVALIAIAACAVAAPASAQLIQRKDLSYAMAKTIAENALADCKARGYAVSVVVVDRGGDTIVALRADNAGPHTLASSERKAWTSASAKNNTQAMMEGAQKNPAGANLVYLPGFLLLGGGVPIKVGNETIGAVGVSGSSSEGDEACAMAGLAKVADQLK